MPNSGKTQDPVTIQASAFEQLANSQLLAALARCFVIAITLIVIPMCSYIAHRVITAGDTLVLKVDEVRVKQELSSQATDFQLRAIDNELKQVTGSIRDHESRLRAVERVTIPPGTILTPSPN